MRRTMNLYGYSAKNGKMTYARVAKVKTNIDIIINTLNNAKWEVSKIETFSTNTFNNFSFYRKDNKNITLQIEIRK